MIEFEPELHPHRRFNPLVDEWVLVSPHRTQRPWQGQQEKSSLPDRPAYDPTCYLCPGNVRANGEVNPAYENTFVFVNDYSALLSGTPEGVVDDGLFRSEAVRGECRVICFSPRHDLTLSKLSQHELELVVDLWASQAAELGARYGWVQIFENRGEAMGASNPHPHGQIWASEHLPSLIIRERASQARYYADHGSRLLLDYAQREVELGSRVVYANEDWAVVVPFWATWPFETMVLPRFAVGRLEDLGLQRASLADALQGLLKRYDSLFDCPFPYSMGWHPAPYSGDFTSSWQLHAHFYPPLLRSATVRKFMVGYEMMAEAQRDLTPEQAAQRLRDAI